MKYAGNIPTTLRKVVERNPERYLEVTHGDGYCSNSGIAYDIFLAPGWCDGDLGCHIIIEDTVKDVLTELRRVIPCNCERCETPA